MKNFKNKYYLIIFMNYQVIYFSRKGNTKKIADAIASELDNKSEEVKNAELKNDTFIFLGSGCYGGKPGKKIQRFIENNDFNNRDIALFGTSGGGDGEETEVMEKMLKEKNANIKGRYFCMGKFWFLNKNKPDEKDIDGAEKFVKKMRG